MNPKELFDDSLSRSRHDKDDIHFIGESLPAPSLIMDNAGTASVGESAIPAREDHIHVGGGGDTGPLVSSLDFMFNNVVPGSESGTETAFVPSLTATTTPTEYAIGSTSFLGNNNYFEATLRINSTLVVDTDPVYMAIKYRQTVGGVPTELYSAAQAPTFYLPVGTHQLMIHHAYLGTFTAANEFLLGYLSFFTSSGSSGISVPAAPHYGRMQWFVDYARVPGTWAAIKSVYGV